jgi:hypothetical protein
MTWPPKEIFTSFFTALRCPARSIIAGNVCPSRTIFTALQSPCSFVSVGEAI